MDYHRGWGHAYVDCFDENDEAISIPLAWTDAGDLNPFNQISDGRSVFRIAELLRLVELIEDLKSEKPRKA